MARIQCIIADDEQEALDRMEQLLAKFDEIEVLAAETDSDAAIQQICKHKPGIVFLDVEMPRKSGFEVVAEVRNKKVFPNFIFVTAYNQYAIKAIKKQAFDYLLKPIDIDELKEAIERYMENAPAFIKEQRLMLLLSEREKEVLRLTTVGNTSREIADKLHISKHTVDTHRRNILRKINPDKNSCT